MEAPKAKRIPHPHVQHGDERPDDYYWLRDRDNQEVIQYLEEENRYFEEVMKPLEALTERLFEQMVARIPESEIKVPVQHGEYFYYSRQEKSLQYPIYARKKASTRNELDSAQEQIILDMNELATDGGYLNVTLQRVSPDHTRLAYLENRDGSDRYTVCIKDLTTGEILTDRISNVFLYGSLEWDATGEYLFYITVDDSQRPYQLWRHHVGASESDVLLYEEIDITFSLYLTKSRSGHYLFAESYTKTNSEMRYLAADDPTGTFKVFEARRPGIKYYLEHSGESFLIRTNDGAENFKLLHCPVENPSFEACKELFPYDDARYLQGVYPFQHAILIAGRQEGLTQFWLYREGTLSTLSWDESLYTVSFGENREYDTHEALIQFESLLTPKTTYSLNMITGEKNVLQTEPVPGVYNPDEYVQERLWATAKDGVKVPLAAVYRADALNKGPAPLILYGYGSYGANKDPRFDPLLLPLLDLGVVYVIAQIRGGSEMGYTWYEDGKLLNKRNTFTDFIAAAEDLIDRGYTSPELLGARGGSAGGLLIGAVINLAPQLFKVVEAAVPFVDVVTTMLDASIPLTTLEWDEWGDPRKAEYYEYMKSYSPYDNVEAKEYPHILATTGLNDPRVAYWEPAKWVARLREMKTDNNVLLLKTNMGAGHFGASGRLNHLKEVAANYAFLLDKIGIR